MMHSNRTQSRARVIVLACLSLASLAAASTAHAWDCKPGVNTEPCILNPTDPGNTNTNSNTNKNSNTQKQGQQQQQQQSQQQDQSQSNNTGNTQNSTYESNYQRSAPAIGQGSIGIVGCGAGGNAGGSNTHGAAFLGVAWTPHDCYLFYLAQGYQAIGQTIAACEVLNRTHASAKLVRDEHMPLPICTPTVVLNPPHAEVGPPTVIVPPCTDCVTRGEVDEKIRRALIKETGK